LRIWKAAFRVNGETLWVGAATHDIGFERDERNNGLTHKIDPDIDLERDYLEKTLCGTGLVTQIFHFLPRNPMREANHRDRRFLPFERTSAHPQACRNRQGSFRYIQQIIF